MCTANCVWLPHFKGLGSLVLLNRSYFVIYHPLDDASLLEVWGSQSGAFSFGSHLTSDPGEAAQVVGKRRFRTNAFPEHDQIPCSTFVSRAISLKSLLSFCAVSAPTQKGIKSHGHLFPFDQFHIKCHKTSVDSWILDGHCVAQRTHVGRWCNNLDKWRISR